jgi:circadian clock protein KaiC
LEELALDYGADRRRLRIAKMRGVKFRGGYHDYTIRTGGLEVFPRLVAAELPQVAPERLRDARTEIVLSGSKELDVLLGGGLRRGTSALLVGPAGSGKSSVALSFIYHAAARGERAALYAFDEGSDSIQERASGLGMNIGPLIASGDVVLHEINPAEMSPGEFTALVCHGAAERNDKLVVVDSLNGTYRRCRRNAFSHSRYISFSPT